ncbi:MAG TPA: hypothetical protein VFV43_06955 [Limnobacter sp.]|nr:hypothetical protein [Limnobacter sp.]
MKLTYKNIFWALLASMALAGCGGGGDGAGSGNVGESGNGGNGGSGGNTGGGNNTPRVMLRGVAAQGAPMMGATITVLGSGGNQGVTTKAGADGSYNVDVTALTPPLRVFANSKASNEAFALTSIAFEGETVANINPATHAITQAMGNAASQVKRTQLMAVLQDALRSYLRTYLVNEEAANFFADANFVANSDKLDAVFDQVNIAFIGNGILIENRANRSIRQTIDTTLNFPLATPLPMATGNTDVNPIQLLNLVQELRDAFAKPTDAPSKMDRALHPDFVDNNGLTAANLALLSVQFKLQIEGHEVLQCFADNAMTQDRCLVRVWVKGTANDPLFDFGNPNFAKVEIAEAQDLMIERRPINTENGVRFGPLRFAGGQFRPYSAYINLLHLAPVNVRANGTQVTAAVTSSFLQLNMPAANASIEALWPAARANTNVRGATLQQTVNNVASNLISVSRPANGQCLGIFNMVRNPSANADCGNLVAADDLGALEVNSRNGAIGLNVLLNNVTNPVNFPAVRIKRGAGVNNAFFPNLDENSRIALHAYGRSNTPATALTITLEPPTGFNQVCIGTSLTSPDDLVCVRERRTVSIPNNLLPARQAQYNLFTADNEGNYFVRQYNLQ